MGNVDFVGMGSGFKKHWATALRAEASLAIVRIGCGGVKPFELIARVIHFDVAVVKSNPSHKSRAMRALTAGAMTVCDPQ